MKLLKTNTRIFIFLLSFFSAAVAKKDQITLNFRDLTVELGGRFNTESYNSVNLNYFNSCIPEDSLFFLRTTFDLYGTFYQGDYEKPRIMFYDAFRFRFKWGTPAEVKNNDSFISIANTNFTVKGAATNKHLMWMREAWLKIMLGSVENHENYIQMGLIPYEVGRGISFGTAYQATGFLGFNPGSSIDQYAPAILLSFNPIENRVIIDFYTAILENHQTSFAENIEQIYENELYGACAKRGIGKQSFLASIRSLISVYRTDTENVVFEPYLLYFKAPDQPLEFPHDSNPSLTTAGLCVEGSGKRFSWGIEGAKNFGELDIKAWDRNYIQISANSSGELIAQATKVYTEDPATVLKPTPATYTTQAVDIIEASPKTRALNGKLIGTIPANGDTPAINLWNAYDRFRPAQVRYVDGYFFVADAMYEFMPKTFNASLGVGYASGYIDPQPDTNLMTEYELMNQHFSSFIPLQSVYSGRRLRHLILFNQGVPRFNVKLPNADLSLKNVTKTSDPQTTNQMTNIAFLGTRGNWNVQKFRKHEVAISQNIIAYWAPETAHYALPRDSEAKKLDAEGNQIPVTQKDFPTQQSRNYIGTEFTTEFSAMIYEKLKIMGYFGFMVPGSHYKDMAGTLITKNKLPSGYDVGYLSNLSIVYFF